MKKIVSMLLCLVMTVLLLVSCGEEEIGAYRKNYTYVPPTVEDVTLEMYIVGDARSDENAVTAVSRTIKQYTETTFKTSLNVHYLSETEYRAEVDAVLAENEKFAAAYATLTAALSNAKSEDAVLDDELTAALPEIEEAVAKIGADASSAKDEAIQTTIGKIVDADVIAALSGNRKIDILLVNSAEMMNDLMAGEKLLDLSDYYASKEYGMLNTKITSLLLDASKCDGKYYSVPNNRMTGSYDYLLMKESMGEKYNFGPLLMASYTSYEDTAELREAIIGGEGISEEGISDYVRVVNGTYADRFKYEEDGYICNTIAYHTPTYEEVYNGSAFSVSAECTRPNRAMEIVYAINQDETLRNLLQYGVANVNYTLSDNTATRITSQGNSYFMNPYYTGNIFNTYYSADDADGWNKVIAEYAKVQNEDIENYKKQNP